MSRFGERKIAYLGNAQFFMVSKLFLEFYANTYNRLSDLYILTRCLLLSILLISWANAMDSALEPNLDQLISSIRSHYLTRYQESISKYRERYLGKPNSAEVLLELQRDTPYIYRLYRVDLASGSVDPPNITEVNLDSYMKFHDMQFVVLGVHITMSPIAWNGVEFSVKPPFSDDHKLQHWAEKWIDVEETASRDEFGLGNYIHSITEPINRESETIFSIDFGSAGTQSWYELLLALKEMGAKRITIGSSTLGN